MVLYYRPVDIPLTYLKGLDLYLWLASILTLFIMIPLFTRNAIRNKENPSKHSLLIAFMLFGVFMVTNKIVFLLSYFTAYYTEFLAVGYVCALFSMIPIIFHFEKYIIKKTRFTLTLLTSLIASMSILVYLFPAYLETIRSIIIIMGMIPMVLFIIVWFYAIYVTVGTIKRDAIITFIGVLCIEVGYFIDSEFIIRTRVLPDELAPLLFLFGLIILSAIQLKES